MPRTEAVAKGLHLDARHDSWRKRYHCSGHSCWAFEVGRISVDCLIDGWVDGFVGGEAVAVVDVLAACLLLAAAVVRSVLRDCLAVVPEHVLARMRFQTVWGTALFDALGVPIDAWGQTAAADFRTSKDHWMLKWYSRSLGR
jgi:hypothetical protein